MMRREYFLRPRLPLPARPPAPYLPLYLARPRPRLLLRRPRPLLLPPLDHARLRPFLQAPQMPPPLPYPQTPSRTSRSLKVVKAPFKKPPRSSSAKGRSRKPPFEANRKKPMKGRAAAARPSGRSRKPPFEANKKKSMKGKGAAARPRAPAPSSFDLVEEVRALHALWRAGSAVSHVDVVRDGPAVSHVDMVRAGPAVRSHIDMVRAGPAVPPTGVARPAGLALPVAPKGKRKLETLEMVNDRRAGLLAEARALHDLWRAGPAVTEQNGRTSSKRKPEPMLGLKGEKSGPPVAGKRKAGTLSNSGKTFKRAQNKRAQKNKKPARRSLRGHPEPHTPSHLIATTFRPQFSHTVEPDDSSEEDEPNASLTRYSDVPLEAEEDVKFVMPTPGTPANKFLSFEDDGAPGTHENESSSFEDGGSPGTHENESSSFGNGGIELQHLSPKKQVISELPEDLQNDAFEQTMEYLNSVGGGIDSEHLTPNLEKVIEDGSFHFFSGLFRENSALRSLYARPGNGSTIDCLVCRSLGESKGFDKVLSLVMHATSRVKRRPEHRGYGRAVSAIVGWNSNRAL